MTTTTIAPEPANVENDRRLMFAAIGRARLAPSVHNTQPWIFHVSSGSIYLLSDSSRLLSTLDPHGRELTISCGAALLHLRLALQASGRTHSVQLLPDAGRPDILARIVLGSEGEIDSHASELDRCANSRQTNRRPYHGSLEAEFSDALQAAAESEHAGLQPIVDDADRTTVKVCQQAADAAQVADPAYRRELRSWVDSRERDDGLPMNTTVEPSGPSHDFAPRDFAFDSAGGFGEQTDDPHTAMFVLFTEGDSPRSWLEAGQALGRLWLERPSWAWFFSRCPRASSIPRRASPCGPRCGSGAPGRSSCCGSAERLRSRVRRGDPRTTSSLSIPNGQRRDQGHCRD